MSREAASCVTSCVGLVAVGVISSPQTLPNVTEGERSSLGKLFNMPKLVEKQLRVQSCLRRKKNCPAERDRGDSGLTKKPATNTQWQPASAVAQLTKFRPPVSKFNREVESPACDFLRHYREISQLSPFASIVIRLPSLRTTIVPD